MENYSAVRRWTPRPDAASRVVCFPHAGGGANAFFAWSKSFPTDIEVCAVEYPGRGTRAAEPSATSAHALVAGLANPLAAILDKPFAVLGYSFGAVVAFEWLRGLSAAVAEALALFVCARRAPHLADDESPLTALGDRAFIAAVQARYGGIPDALLGEPDLLAMMVPSLRADLRISETYRCPAGAALACPVHAFGGELDRSVSRDALAGWASHTRAAFQLDLLPAKHFFMDRPELHDAVIERLRTSHR